MTEQRKVELEVRKVAADKLKANEEKEEKIMFMDTSGLNENKHILSFLATKCWQGSRWT